MDFDIFWCLMFEVYKIVNVKYNINFNGYKIIYFWVYILGNDLGIWILVILGVVVFLL